MCYGQIRQRNYAEDAHTHISCTSEGQIKVCRDRYQQLVRESSVSFCRRASSSVVQVIITGAVGFVLNRTMDAYTHSRIRAHWPFDVVVHCGCHPNLLILLIPPPSNTHLGAACERCRVYICIYIQHSMPTPTPSPMCQNCRGGHQLQYRFSATDGRVLMAFSNSGTEIAANILYFMHVSVFTQSPPLSARSLARSFSVSRTHISGHPYNTQLILMCVMAAVSTGRCQEHTHPHTHTDTIMLFANVRRTHYILHYMAEIHW